mmetsp:Transcript_12251/g.13190  ORF Transcript_12251/g.13190 Transcript_12251/m.13190 type:complete len:161 (+) Transcript_12251:52-534(+)
MLLSIQKRSLKSFSSRLVIFRPLSTEVNEEVQPKGRLLGRKKGDKIVPKHPALSKSELIEIWKATATNQTQIFNTLPATAWPKLFNSLLEVIKTETKEGKRISLVGFGKFYSQHVAARSYRDPVSGGTVEREARTRLRFSSSKTAYEKRPKKTNDEKSEE